MSVCLSQSIASKSTERIKLKLDIHIHVELDESTMQINVDKQNEILELI